MVFQAFMDESEGVDGTFVLAGHIATVEGWAKFARDWEAALPLATLKPHARSSDSVIHAFRPTDERLRPAERFHFKMKVEHERGTPKPRSGVLSDHRRTYHYRSIREGEYP